MKKTFLFALILLLSVSLFSCINNEGRNDAQPQKEGQLQEEPQQTAESDEAAVVRLVEGFGRKLQTVSLQAPSDIVNKSIQENYGDFVSPTLLEEWLSDPQNAPGRLLSSPWPERIEILCIEKFSEEAYEVKGEIIEMTSVELVNGGFAAKQPVTLVIEKIKNRWLISAVTLDTYRETAENLTARQDDKQKEIMDEFNALVTNNTRLVPVVEFINQNISLLSKENASILINKLEEAQKKDLLELEKKFYGDDVQYEMNKINMTGFDMNQINDVNDKELKDLLLETRDSGYRIETAEGMHFPIIDYASYKKYSPYATPDIKDYIDLMAVESNKVPAKDAALVIGWDEVLKRALNQEKFINQYPDSAKINAVKQLYKKYVSFVLYGTDNTPLFSYASKIMADDAKSAYRKAVETDKNSKLLETLRTFLHVLEKNNYQLTNEVEEYREAKNGS